MFLQCSTWYAPAQKRDNVCMQQGRICHSEKPQLQDSQQVCLMFLDCILLIYSLVCNFLHNHNSDSEVQLQRAGYSRKHHINMETDLFASKEKRNFVTLVCKCENLVGLPCLQKCFSAFGMQNIQVVLDNLGSMDDYNQHNSYLSKLLTTTSESVKQCWVKDGSTSTTLYISVVLCIKSTLKHFMAFMVLQRSK